MIVNFLSSVFYPHMCLAIISKLKRSSLHGVGNNTCVTHDLILHLMTIAVLSLLGILSLDWNFWSFLGIFGKVWKCMKWTTCSSFYKLYLVLFLTFIIGPPMLYGTTTDLGIFCYCSRHFWSCICESPGRWWILHLMTIVHSVLKSKWVIACTFSRCRSI